MGAVAPVVEVHGEGVRFAGAGPPLAVELYGDPGVGDHDGAARGGPPGIEGDERAPGPEHGEQADHHLGGAVERDADGLLGGQAPAEQLVGELGGELRRPTVGQRAVLVDEGDGVRPQPGLFEEEFHDGRPDPVGGGVVPRGQGREPLGRAGRADGADGPVGEVRQVVERALRLVGRDACGDGDPDAVRGGRADVPAPGRAAAVGDPAEHVREPGAGGQVESVGAAAGRPVGEADGGGLGHGPVGPVARAPAQPGQAGRREQYGTSTRFRHSMTHPPRKLRSA